MTQECEKESCREAASFGIFPTQTQEGEKKMFEETILCQDEMF